MTEILVLFSLGLLFNPWVCLFAECFGACLFGEEICSPFHSKDELKLLIHLFTAQMLSCGWCFSPQTQKGTKGGNFLFSTNELSFCPETCSVRWLKGNFGWFGVNSPSLHVCFFFCSFLWSFLSFLGFHSIKLSGQVSCLVPRIYLSTHTFTERFINTLSTPPLLCPMPTTAGSSTFLFDEVILLSKAHSVHQRDSWLLFTPFQDL